MQLRFEISAMVSMIAALVACPQADAQQPKLPYINAPLISVAPLGNASFHDRSAYGSLVVGGVLPGVVLVSRRSLESFRAPDRVDSAVVLGRNSPKSGDFLRISGQTFTHFTIRKERGTPDPLNTPIIDDAAPCYHACKDAPAFLAICGGQDLATRAEENRYFVALLNSVGHENAQYLEFAGRDHSSIVDRIPELDDPVAAAILDFVAGHS